MPELRYTGTQVQRRPQSGYHNLLIWQKSKELVVLIYRATEDYPKSELFGLTSQTRRSAVSVLLNIVEGDRRRTKADRLRFFGISDGSLTELEACLELGLELGFLTETRYWEVENKRQELAAMLTSFIKSVKRG